MAFDIYIPSIIGLPPPYNIYLCDPGPINCVLVGASVTVPYTISPVPPQFQGPNQDVYIYAESLDPNYSGSCEPNNILNPDPIFCNCYNVFCIKTGTYSYIDCNGTAFNNIPIVTNASIDLCASSAPTGNDIIVSLVGVCINGLCPQSITLTPTPTQTITPTITPTQTITSTNTPTPTRTPTITPTTNAPLNTLAACLEDMVIMVLYHDQPEFPNNVNPTCYCYEISGSNGKYDYVYCPSGVNVLDVQFQGNNNNPEYVCSRTTPIIVQGNLTVQLIGQCSDGFNCDPPNVTPTPTSTPLLVPPNSFCVSGHICNRTNYILNVDTTIVGYPTLNNSSGPLDIQNYSPYSRVYVSRYNQYTLTTNQVQSIVTASNSNSVTISLVCNVPPPDTCHIDPTFIRIIRKDGYLLYQGCPDYNTITLDPCVVDPNSCRIPQNLAYVNVGSTYTFTWSPVAGVVSYRFSIIRNLFGTLNSATRNDYIVNSNTYSLTLTLSGNYSAFVYSNCTTSNISVESLPVTFTI